MLQLLPWLALNSLTDLSTHHFYDFDFDPIDIQTDRPMFPCNRSDFDIRSFSMHHSNLQPMAIQDLLSRFVALKRFEYRFEDIPKLEDGVSWHQPDLPSTISNSLAHLHGSLEELVMITSAAYDANNNEEPMGLLTAFTRLRTVEASASVLIGGTTPAALLGPLRYETERILEFTQCFPSSLEQLIIVDCSEAIYDAILALLKAGTLENLKRIE